MFLNKVFYREGLLALRPTSKLEDHPLSAACNCLFNLFAATLLIESRYCIRNLTTRHAVVTGTHYTWLRPMNTLIHLKHCGHLPGTVIKNHRLTNCVPSGQALARLLVSCCVILKKKCGIEWNSYFTLSKKYQSHYRPKVSKGFEAV